MQKDASTRHAIAIGFCSLEKHSASRTYAVMGCGHVVVEWADSS